MHDVTFGRIHLCALARAQDRDFCGMHPAECKQMHGAAKFLKRQIESLVAIVLRICVSRKATAK